MIPKDVRYAILNPDNFCQRFLYIKTKKQGIIRLRFNYTQKYIYRKINEIVKLKEPIRIIILKARQQGVSTLMQALIFHKTITSPNTHSLVVSQDNDSSSYIFSMSRLFYEILELPFPKPMRRKIERKELIFENPKESERLYNPGLRSFIRIDTANNLEAGRSFTIHNFHGSEVAFWKDAETLMLAVMQSVPKEPNSFVALESTANGIGDYFHTKWKEAKANKGGFIPIFIPWFIHEEYKTSLPKGEQLTELNEEEEELVKLYKVIPEQLHWRRLCIENDCNGSEDYFRQEYPSNDEEAFISSGFSVFNTKKLRKLYNRATEGVWGIIDNNKFIPRKTSFFRIWKEPDPAFTYVIGADVAGGFGESYSFSDKNKIADLPDYSAAIVICRETLEQVAEWWGYLDPAMFAEDLNIIGKYYRNAMISVEINNHGLTTVNKLKDLMYPNLYRWQYFDHVGSGVSKLLGWQTNMKSRPIMIDVTSRYVNDEVLKLHSKELIEEMMNFIQRPGYREDIEEGMKDDRLFALMIALVTHTQTWYPNSTEAVKYIEEPVFDNDISKELMRIGLESGESVHWLEV